MRPIGELLHFLENQMSMQAVYQPVVILHLLTHQGFAYRTELAQTLSGYDDLGIEHWDRILMDNPRRWLVGKHQILIYDKAERTFQLNFDLADQDVVSQAISLCETAVLTWIQTQIQGQKLEDDEILRLYRVLERAKRGDAYAHPDAVIPEVAHEELAMRLVIDTLAPRFPQAKFTQQPYDTPGFNLLVGDPAEPLAFVNVKATPSPQPVFWLSEGERLFSFDHADRFYLAVVYAIHLATETAEIQLRAGAITAAEGILLPRHWQMTLYPTQKESKLL